MAVLFVVILFSGWFMVNSATSDPLGNGEYEWGQIVSPEALAEKRRSLQLTTLPDGTDWRSCVVHLDYSATDPKLAHAELFIVVDRIEDGRWLAYRGPIGAQVPLAIPGHLAQSTFPVAISIEAIADDDIHVIGWTSYGAFPLGCGGTASTLRLLDHFDMDGTGGNLHILGPSE